MKRYQETRTEAGGFSPRTLVRVTELANDAPSPAGSVEVPNDTPTTGDKWVERVPEWVTAGHESPAPVAQPESGGDNSQ